MRLFPTEPPTNEETAWAFLRNRFRDASKAWADSDPLLSVMCHEFAVLMDQDVHVREEVIGGMDEAVRHHWLGFGQLVVGIPSYNMIWNSSAAYRDALRETVEEVSGDSDYLPGTDQMLADESIFVKVLLEEPPYRNPDYQATDSNGGRKPQSIEECAMYTAARLDEVGRYWNRTTPWLAHISHMFVTILTKPHREREEAFLSFDNRLKFRLTGAFMLVGGNGLVANVLFPTIERYQTDPLASDIPAEFLKNRNTRVADHFRSREEWVATRRGQ